MSVYWSYLLASSVLAIGMTTAARFMASYTDLWPTLIFFNLLLLSWLLLDRAAVGIPWGTAFMVWAGVAGLGTVAIELLWFAGVLSLAQGVSLALVAGGLLGFVFYSWA